MSTIKLKAIDFERWRYTLYATPDNQWIVSFSYSPQRFIDVSMLIELTTEEKAQAKSDRQFLIDMADNIKNRHLDYIDRALNAGNFSFELGYKY